MKKALRKIISIISLTYFFVLFFIFRIFKINNRKVVFVNYYGKGVGDNGKYIANKLIRENNFKLIWLIKKDLITKVKIDHPNIKFVRYKSIMSVYELTTAKFWVDNCRKEFNQNFKRKNQLYIQTWHGSVGLKKIEEDAEKKLGKSYIRAAKRDSKSIDYLLSNSLFSDNLFKHSFWYQGNVIRTGSPRNDIIVSPPNDLSSKIKSNFNIPIDSKICIYAPTFRNVKSLEKYNINFERLNAALVSKFYGKWVIMVRLHPNISNESKYLNFRPGLIDVTNYDDLYEILSISEILITDYSSTMFEFSIKHKPVFLYCSDLNNYNDERGFYFDLNSLPFPIAENNDELENVIKEFDLKLYKDKLDGFQKEIELFEPGNASRNVVEIIKSF